MANETVDTPGVRLPWAGKLVRLERIEEEFAFLWKMSADNMRTGQNLNVRTSILNLVICAPDIESAQRASRLLRDLSTTHLARVVILIFDSNSTASTLSTWVTLRCFSIFSDLMRHCFEQTTLLASGSAIRAVANIKQPLLKPDLPVYLWWIGDPPGNDETFISLVNISNRIIVDSTTFFNPEQDIYTLASLFQAAPDSALSDLNWGRITPWRQLIVQFFDVTAYRPYLDGITSIEIEHAAAPLAIPVRSEQGEVSPNPTRALLLAGWLKARLGLAINPDTAPTATYHDTASGTYHWDLERSTDPRATRSLTPLRGKLAKAVNVSLDIRPQVRSEMHPGSICLVRLTSQIEDTQAIFTISREKDPDTVLTSVELAQETRPQRTVSLEAVRSESELLHDELEITGHDYLFEQTLREVAALLEE